MSVTYTAVLPIRDETVDFLTDLLAAERVRRGTRSDTRSLSVHDQAVLVLRWFLDGTRMRQLARDNGIGKSTGYDYLHEGIDVLATRAPSLHGALLAAKAAGYSHVSIDGVLIETDRVSTPGPTPGVDLWWSGKHANHGGNVQVLTAPDGWPIWTSEVRPGREHDTTAVRTHTEILPTLAEAAGDLRSLGDLGYEGEADTITVAFKKPKHSNLNGVQQQFNKAHNGVRAIGEASSRKCLGWKVSNPVTTTSTIPRLDRTRPPPRQVRGPCGPLRRGRHLPARRAAHNPRPGLDRQTRSRLDPRLQRHHHAGRRRRRRGSVATGTGRRCGPRGPHRASARVYRSRRAAPAAESPAVSSMATGGTTSVRPCCSTAGTSPAPATITRDEHDRIGQPRPPKHHGLPQTGRRCPKGGQPPPVPAE
jgi:hypothetical protein